MKRLNIILILFVFACIACTSQNGKYKVINGKDKASVTADYQTAIVESYDDAADDPAIWIHPTDGMQSKIIGTDKQAGLGVYNLTGDLLYFFDIGRVNNVDVRYNFPLGSRKVDIVAASNRSDNTISILEIEPDSGKLINLEARKIVSGVDGVYGFCLYHNPKKDIFYAIVNSKSGSVEQWELFATEDEKIDAKLVRSIKVGGQTEGCVADDILGYLYIGEETRGIWKYFADPDVSLGRTLVGDTAQNYIVPDVEGLTIYYTGNDNKGYLIASIQGNHSYAIYEREGGNRFVGIFDIVDGEIDGAGETDGIDVINLAFGSTYPNGFFIVQDGYNVEGNDTINQNFKMVKWEKIANSFEPSLLIDNQFNLRR